MADCGKMQSASQYKESQGRGQSGELADRGLSTLDGSLMFRT